MINIPASAYPVNAAIMRLMNAWIMPGDKVLDIGCGDKCYTYPEAEYTTIDAWEKAKPTHLLDLITQDLPFAENTFDVVQMFDIIEHMPKLRGAAILRQAQAVCKRCVLLLTPWVYDRNDGEKPEGSFHRGNPYNLHQSLWIPDDFSTRKWQGGKIQKYYLGAWVKDEI